VRSSNRILETKRQVKDVMLVVAACGCTSLDKLRMGELLRDKLGSGIEMLSSVPSAQRKPQLLAIGLRQISLSKAIMLR
jgi:hypothetical protein